MDTLLLGMDLHKPYSCKECDGELEYLGLGEYKCKKCNAVMYDDYGKVRNFLERNRGANLTETAMATGVTKNVIRTFLREEKIEIAPDSAVFLHCEACGTPIRSGMFCSACASRRSSMAQSTSTRQTQNNIQGFGKASSDASGARRFV